MKNKDFFDLAHIKRYLKASVIRLKGKPIYVVDAQEGGNKKSRFILKYIEVGDDPKAETKTVNIGHPGIDMTPVPLGWLACTKNTKHACAFLSRMPNMQQHVGLCVMNLHTQANHIVHTKKTIYGSRIWTSKELRDTILGNYPSLQQCLDWREGGELYAFSRRFAIAGDDKLYYKYFRHPVGDIINDQPHLYQESGVLREALQEDLR